MKLCQGTAGSRKLHCVKVAAVVMNLLLVLLEKAFIIWHYQHCKIETILHTMDVFILLIQCSTVWVALEQNILSIIGYPYWDIFTWFRQNISVDAFLYTVLFIYLLLRLDIKYFKTLHFNFWSNVHAWSSFICCIINGDVMDSVLKIIFGAIRTTAVLLDESLDLFQMKCIRGMITSVYLK